MAAIRHGREQLPPDVAAQQRRAARTAATAMYRCGYDCGFRGTRDQVDAHMDAAHPVTPLAMTSSSDQDQLAAHRIQTANRPT